MLYRSETVTEWIMFRSGCIEGQRSLSNTYVRIEFEKDYSLFPSENRIYDIKTD